MDDTLQTGATTVRRDDRAAYDRATVHAILDAAHVAHVGLVAADGRPVVVPMLYARDGESLLVHGAPATRLVRSLRRGVDVCVTVTIVDGLVLARSAFHSSMNYRSVVVLGRAVPVTDAAERAAALDTLTDHLAPGRRAHVRPMTAMEAQGTAVLRVPITEASAKVRVGPPVDDEEDYELPIWAGVVPVSATYGAPVPDERNLPGVAVPDHVLALLR